MRGRGTFSAVLRTLAAALTASVVVGALAPSAEAAFVTAVTTTTTTYMVNTDQAGNQVAGFHATPASSQNGQFVAFVTSAAFDPNDTDRGTAGGVNNDVYLKDLGTNAITLISRSMNVDAFGNHPSGNGQSGVNDIIDISADGTRIVYESYASDLVPGDGNGQKDIFLAQYDATTDTVSTRLINVDNAGNPSGAALNASMSDDGNLIAYINYTSLDGVSGHGGLYLYNVANNTNTWLHTAAGSPTSISGDGTTVAYMDGSGYQLHVLDVATKTDVISSVNTSASGDYGSAANLLGPNSHNNGVVAFWSDQADLVTGDTNGLRDMFVNNDGVVSRISVDSCGAQADGDSGYIIGDTPAGAVSADGQRVVFLSNATNIDATTTTPNATSNAFIRFLSSGVTKMISTSDANDPGNASARAVTISPSGTAIAFATNASNIKTETISNTSDVFERIISATDPGAVASCGVPAAPPAPSNVTLSHSASSGSVYPGFSTLAAGSIPATAIPLDATDQISGAPLRSVDIASSPLRSVPLRSVPLRSVPLRSVPLRSVTLSDLPLREGTWEAILATLNPNPFVGVPLQAITLDAVLNAFDAQPAATGLNSVTLGNVDLSSTPLRSVALGSILLGATPLRSVPVPGASSDVFTNWCSLLASLGFTCDSLGLTADSPILAVDLGGVPLRSVPLRSVPLRSVDLSSAPLRSVPLRSVALDQIALGTLPLNKISPASAVVDCALVNCSTDTLGQADTANAVLDGVTLGTLFDHVNANDLPGSLAELLDGLIDTANYPWWELPLEGLQQYAGALAREVVYTVDYDVTGSGTGAGQINVTLPAGFRYKAGSTAPAGSTPLPIGEPAANNEALTWSVTDTGATHRSFTFTAFPGFDLVQNATTAINVTIGSNASGVQNLAPISVIQDFEGSATYYTVYSTDTVYCAFCDTYTVAPYDPSAGATVIQPNTLVASHIGYSGDVDYFKIPVPPKGTRMQIELGNHSSNTDFDVKMFNDAAGTTTGTAPLRSVPLRSVPLRSVPLADQGVDATATGSSVSPETLNDIPDGVAPLRSVSENRGTADELISTVSDAEPTNPDGANYYTIQVTGYNGGFSNEPYVLYVKEYAPPPPPVCSAKTFPTSEGTAGAAPVVAADRETLFLVNKDRMGDAYGAAATDAALAKLNTLAARGDVKGVVYPVESDGNVATAMAAWDADPCSPEKANAAFTAISSLVSTVEQTATGLKNVVVVGGDDMIPMARVADYTQISNESDYAASTLMASGAGTPIAAANATQNILTDDPLGDHDPIPWLDHTLYVPDVAVGRLVETPAEIAAQVDMFIAANGVLAPATSLTTGYDFLADGANAVNGALSGIAPANKKTLVNETWSKADELAALYPATGTPDVAALNAHYDHTRSLPALGNSTGDETDLVTTAEIAANPLLTKRLLFTMGCHAGLAMPKSYTDTAAKDADWAQAYSAKQAAVYFANTGFGYGDTAAVALSEELMRQFASRLDGTMTVGQAAVYAKQGYFAQLGAYGPYDEKAMQEATFYGLPFWKVTSATGTPSVPAPAATPTADADGILSAPISLSNTFQAPAPSGGGGFVVKPAGTTTNGLPVASTGLQVTQYRPIEPKSAVDVTPVAGSVPAGTVAHGTLITGLATHDATTVPAVARPVIDLTATEQPPPAGDASFPTTFQTLTSYNTPAGPRQQAVFLTGQFFDDASPAAAGGTQRLIDSITGEVKYSNSTDFNPPHLTNVVATLNGTDLTISLQSWEEDFYQGAAVKKVNVLVKDGSGAWSLHDLTPAANGYDFSATFPVTGTRFEFFAQSQDAAGNVGVTTNKGRYFTAVPASLTSTPTPPKLSTTPGAPTGSNGWYTGPVGVTVTGTPGVTYDVQVDSGQPAAYTGPVSVSGNGTHVVKAFGSDNTSSSLVVVIDSSAPGITGAPDRPANSNGWYNAPVDVRFTCTDNQGGSGVRSCGPDTKLSTDGTNLTATGTALDFAGNSSASFTVGPLKLDQVKPELTITGVTDGQGYTTGAVPTPGCTASDALSGLDGGCSGTVTGGLSNGVGVYTYTATVKDKAGNVTTKSVSWRALYRFDGFLQPINDTAHYQGLSTSIFAAGSTVPVKFQLKRADGTLIQPTSAPLWITPIKGAAVAQAPNESAISTAATSGTTFMYDPVNQQWVYNWKTTKKDAGYYYLVGVKLDDGSIYTVVIGLK